MTQIKKNDFIEVEYTGKIKEDNLVFDTTDESIAKQAGIHSPNMKYGPAVICIGEGQLLKGLEDELEGKEIGKAYTIDVEPVDGFGKKDAKLIKMIPAAIFKKQNITPQPGLQVNVDGLIGIIKTAAGGRCLVDFNHPLSGKELTYEIKVNKVVTDDKEKIKSFLALSLHLKDVEVDIKEGKAAITMKKELPKELQEKVLVKLKELIPDVKEFSFVKI